MLQISRPTPPFCKEGWISQTYGEPLIPEAYLVNTYSRFFSTVKFVPPNYDQLLYQAVIVLKK